MTQTDFEGDDDGPIGPPLTDDEIIREREHLARWQSPTDFAIRTRALCRRCTSADFFLQPRLKFLHDAHVLAKFVTLHLTDSVRLVPASEQWPDGQIREQGDNIVKNIEITSTHGDRRLGDEYRNVTGWTWDPVQDWVKRAEWIPKHLDEVIGAKSKKHYGSKCWLVVYLNINDWGIRQKETEQVIAETKAKYSEAFSAISVIWKGKLY